MLLIYGIARYALRGPLWFGTLAATLFMVHPLLTESAASLCGSQDLLPIFPPLLATLLWMKMHHRYERCGPSAGVALYECAALLMAALSTLAWPASLMLGLALAASDWLAFVRTPGRHRRLFLMFVATFLALYLHPSFYSADSLAPGPSFAPLQFLVYPFGLLPGTADLFASHPVLHVLSAALTLFTLGLVLRRAARPELNWLVLAVFLLRLGQGRSAVDLVNFAGGGRMLLPGAFAMLAVACVFYRIMDHPAWRKPVVTITTLVCVMLFGVRIYEHLAWREAAREVRSNQQAAAAIAPGERVGFLPDYRQYRSAPLCLSDAFVCNTPFSTRRDFVSILPMHYPASGKEKVTVASQTPESAIIRVEGMSPAEAFTGILYLRQPGDVVLWNGSTLRLSEVRDEGGFTLSVATSPGVRFSRVTTSSLAAP
jgi:hypothetical protein